MSFFWTLRELAALYATLIVAVVCAIACGAMAAHLNASVGWFVAIGIALMGIWIVAGVVVKWRSRQP